MVDLTHEVDLILLYGLITNAALIIGLHTLAS